MKQTTASTLYSIKVLLRKGLSQRKVAARLGVGLGTVNKYKKLLAPDIPGLWAWSRSKDH
jgi:transposase